MAATFQEANSLIEDATFRARIRVAMIAEATRGIKRDTGKTDSFFSLNVLFEAVQSDAPARAMAALVALERQMNADHTQVTDNELQLLVRKNIQVLGFAADVRAGKRNADLDESRA